MKKPVPAAFLAHQFKKGAKAAPKMSIGPMPAQTPAAAPKKVPMKTAPAAAKAVPYAPPAAAFPMDALHAGNAEKKGK